MPLQAVISGVVYSLGDIMAQVSGGQVAVGLGLEGHGFFRAGWAGCWKGPQVLP